MKNLITSALLLLALLPAIAAANPITPQQAQQNALTFMEIKGKSLDISALRHAPTRLSMTSSASYYVFNIGNNEGYVIASGDDCAPAILGYADSGYIDIDSLPENMKGWLEEYARQIQFIQEKGLRSFHQSELTSNLAPISPLLTSIWGQDYPYNQNCPSFFGYGQCVTGCVATAMAQVMYYHRSNSVSQTTATIPAYTCKRKWNFVSGSQQISVDAIPAGAFIDWDAMIDDYFGYETSRQKQAVANLMKYCGASVQMDYADGYNGGSGASSTKVPDALKSYFNYNNGTSLESRSDFSTDDEWNNLIYSELKQSRPVYYSGGNSSSAHAFVCDGYDGAGFFHINWGWNGYCDGYFLLTALNPEGGSSGYNQRQEALINAFPKSKTPIDSPIISFADDNVKALCVQYWDFDGDGELSQAEAALVTTLNDVFDDNRDITSFNELKFFTGLSRIGTYAFWGCSGLTSVIIPSSVSSIGAGAFSGCSALANIEIPSSVTEIGRNAFNGTAWYNNQPDGLIYVGLIAYKYKGTVPEGASITIKDGTLRIAGYAFEGCNGLSSVTIPNSVTYIGPHVFWDCRSLSSVNIPNSVASINVGLFRGCISLSSVSIPNSVTSIGREAFENCRSLTSVTIPNSVTSIGNSAFRGCKGLTSVIIPNSVTSIGSTAFGDCIGLTSVAIPSSVTSIDNYTFENCRSLTSVTIPNSVTSIGLAAFRGCNGLTSVTIGSSVTSIDDLAFDGCTSLMSIVVNSRNTKYDSRDNCNAIIKTSSNTLILGCQNTVIPNSVTSIGDYAFSSCSGLTSVNIPSSVTSIGDYAFSGCSGLTSVTIPNSITFIGDGAFGYCIGLMDLMIPNSVTFIGDYAFRGCTGLTSMTIPNSITFIGDGTFYDCIGLSSLSIPNSVTSIGYLAFYNCTGLTSIMIPNSVTSIGFGAFYGCTGLTRLIIPNSVTVISSGAFYECRGLTNVYSYIADLSQVTAENRSFAVNGNYDYSSRTLHVLQGTVDDYRADENWYLYFGQIVDDLVPGTLPGDVNGDLEVNIADVNAVINIILGGNDDTTAADVNGDLEVNIADINAIIHIILSGSWN